VCEKTLGVETGNETSALIRNEVTLGVEIGNKTSKEARGVCVCVCTYNILCIACAMLHHTLLYACIPTAFGGL
jgi:hypothetical protein